jgi:hypothetical protein
MKVYWLTTEEDTRAKGYWNTYLLEDILKDEEHIIGQIPDDADTGIVMIQSWRHIDEIGANLNKLKSCLVIKTGDEEYNFDTGKLVGENRKVFCQYPGNRQGVDKYIPLGPSREVPQFDNDRIYNWCIMGQITDPFRVRIAEQTRKMNGGYSIETNGFARGLPYEMFCEVLSQSKVSICLPGGHSADSFRLYETLESGAIPIAFHSAYHQQLFPDGVPFPVLDNPVLIPSTVVSCVNNFDELSKQCSEWWQNEKIKLRDAIYSTSKELGIK